MSITIRPAVWHDFNRKVFMCVGVPYEEAKLAAAARLESALRQPSGLDAFAVRRLQNTVRRLQDGGINPTPQLNILQEQANIALLDGDNGLGPVIGTRAMSYCLEKAKARGLALVGVRNATTLGAMSFYAMQALQHHAIGFVATNTELKIGLPPWGGVTPALGNNPFAIAIPMQPEPSLVLDMSVIATQPQDTSSHNASSSRAPLGTDFLSRPIIGDHKGYGLALVLEVLTGVLTGAGFGQQHAPKRLASPDTMHDLGHLFGVLHPDVFISREMFYERMQQLRHEIIQSERAPGVTRIFLPGEIEYERRLDREQNGIPVHDEAPVDLQTLCTNLGLNLPSFV
ncbi:MAG: Ldh family oxidoreductase [bacterium]|nr:Ldh family oxidoreductase [bacterium]